MKKLKPGTEVKISQKYLEWEQQNADEMYVFPSLFMDKDQTNWSGETRSELLSGYLMWRYSFQYEKDVHGVIVGDNGYEGDEFAYLVWCVNQIGEDAVYLNVEDVEEL